MKIEDIEGIGPSYGEKLRAAGIINAEKLLERGGSRQGRQEIAQETGIDGARILKWVNLCDLCRIAGVSTQYSELLEAAGVDTVKELKTRLAENLTAKMNEVNAVKKLVRQVPTEAMVGKWIQQAKELPPMVNH